jgi:hypothetical protein
LQELQALRRKGLRHVIEEDAGETAPHADAAASVPAQPSASSNSASREIAKQTPPPHAAASREPVPERSTAPATAPAVPAPTQGGAPRDSHHTGLGESARQTPVAGGQATEPRARAAA